MNQERKNDPFCCGECQSRPSFREAFRRAAEQVELHCCEPIETEPFRELCYIIAEVYMLDPYSRIRIADETFDAYLVQDIFGELELDHLRLVWNNFRSQTGIIKNKRAYLRTALYNSVFEFEAHHTNVASHILSEYGAKK